MVRQVYPKLSMNPDLLPGPAFQQGRTVAAACWPDKSISTACSVRCALWNSTAATPARQSTPRQDHQGGAGGERTQRLRSWPFARWATGVQRQGTGGDAGQPTPTHRTTTRPQTSAPANKTIAVSAACLEDGTEVVLDQGSRPTRGEQLRCGKSWLNYDRLRCGGNNTAA